MNLPGTITWAVSSLRAYMLWKHVGLAGTPSRLRCSITHLPVELLEEIFVHCLPPLHVIEDEMNTEYMRKYRIRNRSCSAPVVLTQVCKLWRAASLAMPTLWATHASNFSISDECSQLELQGLRQSLAYSKDLPLTLFLWLNNRDMYQPKDLPQLLASLTSRCRHVVLRNPNPNLLVTLFNDLPFPLLEHIEISCYDCRKHHSPFVEWQEFPSLVTAPKLRSVELVWPHIDGYILSLPWTQLTSLVLHDGEANGMLQLVWQDCLDVLVCCPNLTCYKVSSHGGRISPQAVVTATDLEDLYLETVEDCDQLLNHLTLPSLANLALGTEHLEGLLTPWPGEALGRMVRRSSCSLRELTLYHVHVPFESLLVRFLRDVPQLQRLELRDHDRPLARPLISQSLMSALAATTDDDMEILPNLEHLELHHLRTSSSKSLADVVEARGWGRDAEHRRRLRRVHCRLVVPQNWWEREPGRARLLAFQNMGLSIQCWWYKEDEDKRLNLLATL